MDKMEFQVKTVLDRIQDLSKPLSQFVMVRMVFQVKTVLDHTQDLLKLPFQFVMVKMVFQEWIVRDHTQVFLNHTQFAMVWTETQARTVSTKMEPRKNQPFSLQDLNSAGCSQLAQQLSLKTANQFALKPSLLAAPKPVLVFHLQETDSRENTPGKVKDSEMKKSLDYII